MPESDPTRQQTESVRHLVGDKSAFEAFHRATVARLVRFLMLNGAPHPDATEIAQETLIKAYQRWHAIDNPWTWSYRVASRDWIRRATSVKEEPVVDPAELTGDEGCGFEPYETVIVGNGLTLTTIVTPDRDGSYSRDLVEAVVSALAE